MDDPLSPPVRVLAKLGSIVGHAEEYNGPQGHPFDLTAMRSLLLDPEVQEWMALMRERQMVPMPREKK